MTSVSVQVSIESWGEYCGTRPQSHSQKTQKPVMIQDVGGHLVMSEGVRTDRCGSPNPRIKTVLARRTETRWRRECQTPADDPKFERGVYTLNAVNSNRIEYVSESRFVWTLKGDHCVATAREKRVFIRAQKKTKSKPAAEPASTATSGPTEDGPEPLGDGPDTAGPDTAAEACADVGPVARFELVPSSIRVGPGERFCFRVVARDDKGCPLKNPMLKWRVSQDDVEIQGLITKAGCFKAGETAAESEGVYQVAARLGAHLATAEINVLFEDLGDLFAARLRPLQDITGTPPAPASAKAGPERASTSNPIKIGPAPVVPVSPQPEKKGIMLWIILLGVIVAATLAGLFLLIGRFRKQTAETTLEEFEDWPDLPDRDEDEVEDEKDEEQPREKYNPLTCPECGRIYKRNAKYCAYDKTTLVSISKTPLEIPEGMICPKCHRGYEKDARFCPHDSEPLVQYSDWRSTKKPNSKG